MTENEQNPFLIPPPPKADPVPPEPAEVEEPDLAAPLITLPPGLVDSATHRLGARVTRRPTPEDDAVPVRPISDEVVFFPAPPGASATAAPDRPAAPETPAAPVSATSASAASAPPSPAPLSPAPLSPAPSRPAPARTSWLGASADATVIRPTGSTASWRLTLPSGETVQLGATTFVGRNPAPTAGWPDADLLPISDPAKSVSKTHALLEIADGRLWVHDLDSTNGVWLIVDGADDTQVPPRQRVAVPPGADLELGDLTIQIEHSGT